MECSEQADEWNGTALHITWTGSQHHPLGTGTARQRHEPHGMASTTPRKDHDSQCLRCKSNRGDNDSYADDDRLILECSSDSHACGAQGLVAGDVKNVARLAGLLVGFENSGICVNLIIGHLDN